MRSLPDAMDRFGVFSTTEATAAGWTMSALKHAVATGRLRRIRAGAYVAAEPAGGEALSHHAATARHDSIGAALAIGGSAVSHRSAALVHDLPTLSIERPCLTIARSAGQAHRDVHLHRARLPPAHLCIGAISVTSVARTIVDLGREHGFDEAVVAGDAALRIGVVSSTDLENVLEDCRGWPGTRAARAAVQFLDGASESVLESLSRIQIRRHGLPEPLLQPSIIDEYGTFVARCDFLFEQLGVIGEADGVAKYELAGVERHEQQRRQRLENLGFGFVRWQYRDLRAFDVIAERIWHAARHRSGVPRARIAMNRHP